MNKYGLKRIVGEDRNNKIYKMLGFVDDEKLKGKDVDDPWYTRDFDLCFEEIEMGCEGLLLHLKEES